MSFATTLAERLAALTRLPASKELAIADWRILVDSATSADVGLKDGHLGGPYDAPNVVSGTRGEAYLRWADGRVSTGTIDRTTLENLEEDLALWRQAAYEDEFAAEILGPQPIPEVPLHDAAVAAMVLGEQAPMFEVLARLKAELAPYEVDRVSGGVTVSETNRRLLTSRGLDHASRATSVGVYADADHRAYDYVSSRDFPQASEIDRLIRSVGETNRLLRREATVRPGRQPIVFMPGPTESRLGKFLFPNLDGQRVLNGSSAYALEQFLEGASLFDPAFGLAIDPLVPMSPGSYAATREGVPARRLSLIAGGKLVTPLLDLKHARKSGLAPTPFPRGGSSLRLEGPTEPLEALIRGLEHGFVVYQMLGLHTQDSVRGRFSLTVSQGLVVENGELKGHAKALIAGHFMQALNEPFRLGAVAGKDVPALVIQGDVMPG